MQANRYTAAALAGGIHALLDHTEEALDALPVAVCFADAEGVIQRYNRRAAELWGREPLCGDSEELFSGAFRLYWADGTFLPHAYCPLAITLQTKEPMRNQQPIIERPDGTRRAALVNVEPIFDDTGRLIGAVSTTVDVTDWNPTAYLDQARVATLVAVVSQSFVEREKLVQSLEDASTALVKFLDLAGACIWTYDNPGGLPKLQTCAGEVPFCAMLPEELKATNVLVGKLAHTYRPVLIEIDDTAADVPFGDWAVEQAIRAFAAIPLVVEHRIVGLIALYGRRHYSENDLKLLTPVANNIAMGVERKHSEQTVKQSEARFRQMAGSVSDAFWVTKADRSTQVIYVSPGYETLTGRLPNTLIDDPSSFLTAMHPDDRERVQLILGERDRLGECEFRVMHTDGTQRWIAFRSIVMQGQGGEPDSLFEITRDISDRKTLERQLWQMKKAEMIAQAAGWADCAEVHNSV